MRCLHPACRLAPVLGLGLTILLPPTPSPAAPLPAAQAADKEADVWAAALRLCSAHGRGPLNHGSPIFLWIDRDTAHGQQERDPSDAEITRLRQRGVTVRKKSGAKFVPHRMGMFLGYFVDPKTGEAADAIGLTSVHWVSPTRAEVNLDFMAGGEKWAMALTRKGWVKVKQWPTYVI